MEMISERDLQILADECISDIRERLESTGTNASGRTSTGLFSEIEPNNLRIFSDRPGFGNVEWGQEPGKRPRNFQDIIKQWIEDKGLPVQLMPYSPKYKGFRKFQNEYDRGLHYMSGAIAWSNRSRGSKLFRAGGRDDIFTPALNSLVEKVKEKAGDEMMRKINIILLQKEK